MHLDILGFGEAQVFHGHETGKAPGPGRVLLHLEMGLLHVGAGDRWRARRRPGLGEKEMLLAGMFLRVELAARFVIVDAFDQHDPDEAPE